MVVSVIALILAVSALIAAVIVQYVQCRYAKQ